MEQHWTHLAEGLKLPGESRERIRAQLVSQPIQQEAVSLKKKTLHLHRVLIAAALCVVLAITALAVASHLDVLSIYFRGDTTPAQKYMDTTTYTVSDENYTLTVDSLMADEGAAFFSATITARNEATREFLFSDDFAGVETFNTLVRVPPEEVSSQGCEFCGVGTRYGEHETSVADSRSFHFSVTDLHYPTDTLLFYCGYMEEGKTLELPITPAPSVTVEIGATGQGIPDSDTHEPGTITISSVKLSPFYCVVDCSDAPAQTSHEYQPRIFFRMADGSIRTQNQMASYADGNYSQERWKDENGITHGRMTDKYRFYEVQTLEDITSIIVFDREYPLDGSASFPVEHDPSLDPFTARRMERLAEGAGYSIPVQELTQKLGGTYDQDPITGEVTCTYRGVTIVLRPGSDTAYVDGEAVSVGNDIPALQDGFLAAPYKLFENAWGIEAILKYDESLGDNHWGDWYIIP